MISRPFIRLSIIFLSLSSFISMSQAECEDFKIDVCYMEKTTKINTPDSQVSSIRDETSGLYFSDNKKIFHLPVKLYKTFPRLFTYHASNCSIHELSNKHFERLSRLGELYLKDNQIKTIGSDTFFGLISLWRIDLENNQIKQMNGKTFEHFKPQINLKMNDCIDEDFRFRNQNLQQKVTMNCAYDEPEVYSKVISCEEIARNTTRRCYMDNYTEVRSNDVQISYMREEVLDMIDFHNNVKVEHLPIEVHEIFPNLRVILAANCSIRAISRKNLRNLNRLSTLNLAGNQIEMISSNTFEGLPSLRWIHIQRNRIKFLNGRLFERMLALDFVDLESNVCMSQRFINVNTQILADNVTAYCGFNETITGEFAFETLLEGSCGTFSFTTGLVIGGTEIRHGQYPFLVALIQASTNLFFCGGTLISSKHVLTAAHCMQQKGDEAKLKSREVIALIGKHNLFKRDQKAATRLVEKVVIHPSWKYDDPKYDADIAFLVLNYPVEFSTFVQPICLTVNPEMLAIEDGTVAGWGKIERSTSGHTNIPRQVSINSVSANVCFGKDHLLGEIYSERMFCAGGFGSGPCTGDSGGGFFVEFRGLWTLKGIVSSAAINSATGQCDVERYTLFTNVVDFADWIKEEVKANP